MMRVFCSTLKPGCNTDIGDTLIRRCIKGKQNASMETSPVATPSHKRLNEGSGKAVDISPASMDEIISCPAHPATRPMPAPITNRAINWIRNTCTSFFGVAPSVFNTATCIKWRFTNREEAKAIAIPDRITASVPANNKKDCALPMVSPIRSPFCVGVRQRCPSFSCGVTHVSYCSSKFLSPASSRL